MTPQGEVPSDRKKIDNSVNQLHDRVRQKPELGVVGKGAEQLYPNLNTVDGLPVVYVLLIF